VDLLPDPNMALRSKYRVLSDKLFSASPDHSQGDRLVCEAPIAQTAIARRQRSDPSCSESFLQAVLYHRYNGVGVENLSWVPGAASWT